MVKKTSKKNETNTTQKLKLVMSSGKCALGYKETLHALRTQAAKLLIISNNTPAIRRSELEYYAILARCGVHAFPGNNVDLGTACGKMFRVGVAAIIDPGDSDIIKMH